MRFSVFTPSHNPRYLDDCYDSLARQTLEDWEWIVLLNGDAPDWSPSREDERVRVMRAGAAIRGVGAAKREACEAATGDVLVELDHDDVLASTCLAEVADAFAADPGAVLVYSDFTQINEDGSRNDRRFNQSMGWVYDEVFVDGQWYLRCQAMAPLPHNIGYIWYAPNHVRAFRRDAYERVGGYNPSLEVLDDQDLMVRLYQDGEFSHLPRCLYMQRVHPANTQVDPAINAHIQQKTVEMYRESIVDLTKAWARRKHLVALGLRTSTSPDDPVDPELEIQTIDPVAPRITAGDETAAIIVASEVLQRVPDRAALFNECYRVLAHGGVIFTHTPSTDGRGAFQDPSHVAFYNENSFRYVTQANLRTSLPALTARLQVSHQRTFHPTPWHEELKIPYVQANLLAVKDGPRMGGPLLN